MFYKNCNYQDVPTSHTDSFVRVTLWIDRRRDWPLSYILSSSRGNISLQVKCNEGAKTVQLDTSSCRIFAIVREFLSTKFAAWTVFITFGFISAAVACCEEDLTMISFCNENYN